jgi:hypothetical protein
MPFFFHFDTNVGRFFSRQTIPPSGSSADSHHGTATTVEPSVTNAEALTGDVIVQNTCGEQIHGFGGATAISVVAAPNVIAVVVPAKITATARDSSASLSRTGSL